MRVVAGTIAGNMRSHSCRWIVATAALGLGFSAAAAAAQLASTVLLTPLAPHQKSSVSIPMPAGLAPDQPVWVAYELVALSATDDGDGELGIEQSFEGVKTSTREFFATFHAREMQAQKSAGTVAAQLEQIAGHHEPAELRQLMGAELHAAYEAVNAGNGRILTGRSVHRLAAPERSDAPLLIAVERAQGMQPVALKVSVGQGDLPREFQQKTEDTGAWKLDYGLGLLAFGWLVMRFFRRRAA